VALVGNIGLVVDNLSAHAGHVPVVGVLPNLRDGADPINKEYTIKDTGNHS
jgi:hypothetical protein